MINNSKRWWKRTSLTSDTAKIPLNTSTGPTSKSSATGTQDVRQPDNSNTDSVPVIVMNDDNKSSKNNDNFSTRALKGSTLTDDNETDTEGTPSVYSYGESWFAPSLSSNISPSMRVLRGRSEYSTKTNGSKDYISGGNGHSSSNNYLDIESTTSILDKPWVSSQVMPNPSNASTPQTTTPGNHTAGHTDSMHHNFRSRPNENGLDTKVGYHTVSAADNGIPRAQTMSTEAIEPTKRRGSLGKLKAGLGRLLNGNRTSQQHYPPSRHSNVVT